MKLTFSLLLLAALLRADSYVAMDSPVYAALDALASMGLIRSHVTGIRPWTVLECQRQTEEARQSLRETDGLADAAAPWFRILKRELPEGDRPYGWRLRTLYLRQGVIAGEPLADGWHLGQTWTGDMGRPFGRGWNSIAGGSSEVSSRRFHAVVTAEHQQAPAAPHYDAAVYRTLAKLDGVPAGALSARGAVSRVRLIEAYGGVRLGSVGIRAGKQPLWWGTTYDTPLSFSNNAEPTSNVRITTEEAVELPSVLKRLGSVRVDLVLGKLEGHQFTSRPWFHGQKISFKLTSDLEMGFTRWTMFWGAGHPKTFRSIIRSFTSVSSAAPTGPVDATDPGDRKGGFDFRWRLPGVGRYVTLYTDSYAEDDPSPLAAPRRAAISPGIHLTRIPAVPGLDLRIEAASTDPMGSNHNGAFNYYNNQYRSGNTNNGFPLGSWVGRAGRAIQAWSTWTHPSALRIQTSWRHFKGAPTFLPGGATDTRAAVRLSAPVDRSWTLEAFVQAERYAFPILGPGRRNVSGWLALRWNGDFCLVCS
jgi:hypothetical protein